MSVDGYIYEGTNRDWQLRSFLHWVGDYQREAFIGMKPQQLVSIYRAIGGTLDWAMVATAKLRRLERYGMHKESLRFVVWYDVGPKPEIVQ